MARPVAFLAVSVAALLALAVPALNLRMFTPDARIVPVSSPVRFGYDTVREQFGPGAAAPIQVVVRTAAPLPALRDRLAALEHVTRVDSALDALRAASPDHPLELLHPAAFTRLPADLRRTVDHYLSADRRTVVFELVADDYAASEGVRALLATARDVAARSGLPAAVGGEAAEGVDANAAIERGLPAVIAVMLGAMYVMLLLTFRSVLLPVKAILVNLLSLGATYGVLVLVFQHALGFGYLQNFVPTLLLAILFSLSTD